jgi:tetratricopeptide (TPR) repeat protein
MGKVALSMPVAALAAVLISLPVMGTGCQKLQARDHLNKGVTEFKNAQYEKAVEHFKTAVELDPTFSTARLYLGTAYMQQWIPGSASEDNQKLAAAAESTFRDVLKDDPKNVLAISNIASLYLNEQKWDDARVWYDKLTAADPKSAVGYYSKAFIDWSQWYPADGKARVDTGMRLEDPGPLKDKKVKQALKDKYTSIIDDGITNLDKALQVDPDYDDAMAYENLLVREKADLADTKEEYEQQIKIANDWVDKAMAVKKKKIEAKQKATPGGIIADQK